MLARTTAVALALAVASPALARHQAKQRPDDALDFPTTPCSGTVSGAMKGSFTCKASVRPHSQALRIDFTPVKLPKGARSFMLGDIEIVGARAGTTYTLPMLKAAQMSISDAKHHRFNVAKIVHEPKRGETTAPPPTITGEMTLKLEKVATTAHEASAASGTVTARLVPSDPKVKGDVLLTLKF